METLPVLSQPEISPYEYSDGNKTKMIVILFSTAIVILLRLHFKCLLYPNFLKSFNISLIKIKFD